MAKMWVVVAIRYRTACSKRVVFLLYRICFKINHPNGEDLNRTRWKEDPVLFQLIFDPRLEKIHPLSRATVDKYLCSEGHKADRTPESLLTIRFHTRSFLFLLCVWQRQRFSSLCHMCIGGDWLRRCERSALPSWGKPSRPLPRIPTPPEESPISDAFGHWQLFLGA